MSEHLAVACLRTHLQHIPEQKENNSRIIVIWRFSHIAILQTEKLASVLPPSHLQGSVLITHYVERIRLVILGFINIILRHSTGFFLFPNGAANWQKATFSCNVAWHNPIRNRRGVSWGNTRLWRCGSHLQVSTLTKAGGKEAWDINLHVVSGWMQMRIYLITK
jgi:hypothetical protein